MLTFLSDFFVVAGTSVDDQIYFLNVFFVFNGKEYIGFRSALT